MRHLREAARLIGIQPFGERQVGREELPRHDVGERRKQFIILYAPFALGVIIQTRQVKCDGGGRLLQQMPPFPDYRAISPSLAQPAKQRQRIRRRLAGWRKQDNRFPPV
jgi:hypothetical protein